MTDMTKGSHPSHPGHQNAIVFGWADHLEPWAVLKVTKSHIYGYCIKKCIYIYMICNLYELINIYIYILLGYILINTVHHVLYMCISPIINHHHIYNMF
jgi:hypothetical protein